VCLAGGVWSAIFGARLRWRSQIDLSPRRMHGRHPIESHYTVTSVYAPFMVTTCPENMLSRTYLSNNNVGPKRGQADDQAASERQEDEQEDN